MIQVITVRENSAIAFARRLRQRLLPLPGLNYSVSGQARAQNFIPANHLLAMFAEDGLDTLVEIGVQFLAVSKSVLFTERLNRGVVKPLRVQHLVAADVEVFVRKQARHFSNQTVQKSVGLIARRVERGFEDSPFPLDLKWTRRAGKLRVADEPTGGVPRNVELRHDADAALTRISQHSTNIGLRVEVTVRTQLVELREYLALYSEALVIRQMPVKNVELYGCHRVEIPLDHRDGHPMAGNIQHQPAPRKSGTVLDLDSRYCEGIGIGEDQLRERLHAAQRPGNGRSGKMCTGSSDFQLIGFIVADGRIFGAALGALDDQRRLCSTGDGNACLPGDFRGEARHCGFESAIGVA